MCTAHHEWYIVNILDYVIIRTGLILLLLLFWQAHILAGIKCIVSYPHPTPIVGCNSSLSPAPLALVELFGVCPWMHEWARTWMSHEFKVQRSARYLGSLYTEFGATSLCLSPSWNFYSHFPAMTVIPNSVLWLFRAVKLFIFYRILVALHSTNWDLFELS